MGIVGALVIANWAYRLLRDTGGMLLDMNADRDMAEKVRRTHGDLRSLSHLTIEVIPA